MVPWKWNEMLRCPAIFPACLWSTEAGIVWSGRYLYRASWSWWLQDPIKQKRSHSVAISSAESHSLYSRNLSFLWVISKLVCLLTCSLWCTTIQIIQRKTQLNTPNMRRVHSRTSHYDIINTARIQVNILLTVTEPHRSNKLQICLHCSKTPLSAAA